MLNKKKILLINPPGRKIYIRDYYCSKVSKAYYLPQPIDLLIQSSFFEREEYELKAMDCIAENINKTEALEKLVDFHPDFIITQVGSVSLVEDVAFFTQVKSTLPSVKIIASGDALLEDHEELFKIYSWLDVIVTNFFNDGAKKWIEKDFEAAAGIVYRGENGTETKSEKRTVKLELEVPRHDLFIQGNYRMPFANAMPMATVLTNYACPYPCTFCIMSTMPYITRSAESIILELKELKRLNYKYIYFSDQTFFQSKAVTREVLNWMIEADYGLSWMCFSRVDVLGEEEITLMKKSGCNLIMFGVEFADEEYLNEYKKNYTLDQIRETFDLTAKAGIKRLGTFLIGVPGQSEESILRTLKFAKEIKADYASFNVAVPRSNTSFREQAIEQGIIDDSVKIMDQSGDEVTMGTGKISREELQKLKRKAYLSFYFRPSYLLKILFRIRNRTEFKMHLREAYFILK
ncbi:MAG: radical SAM protein [Flavobacteriales bacterium]|nr:radical SAM protein [Flavobacteriales bacterium]